ncbi:lipopolysaccharide biosynthesis protein [Planctomicrobium sp. SH664]|uniref:lipopolysaccharide biosynthesis protein n=1 Tax=Planctomicrobium sp. SH664 TaxID=3448125 RepID=UPI003F5C2078
MAINLISLPILVKSVGLDVYGIWVVLRTTVDLCQLGDLGLSTTITVFLAADLKSDNRKSTTQTLVVSSGLMLMMCLILGLALAALAPFCATFFHGLPTQQFFTVRHAWLIFALIAPLQLMHRFADAVLEAKQNYQLITVLITVSTLLEHGIVIITAWLSQQLIPMSLALLGASLFVLALRLLAVYFLVIRPIGPAELKWSTSRLKEIATHAGGTCSVFIGAFLFGTVDKLIVGATLGSEAVGLYGIASSICRQVTALASAFLRPILPAIAATTAQPETPERQAYRHQLLKRGIWKNSLASGALATGLFAISPFLPLLIKDVDGILPEIRAMTFIYTINSMNAAGFYYCLGARMAGAVALATITGACLSLAGMYFTAPIWGFKAAIYSNALYCVSYILTDLAWQNSGGKRLSWTPIAGGVLAVLAGIWLFTARFGDQLNTSVMNTIRFFLR